jgi:xylan 1,4-beta-xylosidase
MHQIGFAEATGKPREAQETGRMKRLVLSLLLFSQAFADPTYHNPVLPGDYPDPSIVRVRDGYWAAATSSEWGPEFPLMYSPDLVNWELRSTVFTKRPEWAVGKFWAPELVEHRGKYFVYYSADMKGGPLSVAVASADRPEGPYTDHGPLISQEVGSIDAAPASDVNGDRYLVWKEDGNSARRPTPIWAQRLADDGVTLHGPVHELLSNDPDSWEGHLIEAPYIMRRGDYLYLFYSANACCEESCNYAVGVARARQLLGPWERCPNNPILAGNRHFRCPGHGSLVTDPSGRTFFLYHAMATRDSVFVGRQLMVDEVQWGEDGWPVINGGNGPSAEAAVPEAPQQPPQRSFEQRFETGPLGPGWEWPSTAPPDFSLSQSGLHLRPSPQFTVSPLARGLLARKTLSADYVAETEVQPGQATAGLAAYGNDRKSAGISVGGGQIRLWEVRKGLPQPEITVPFDHPRAQLQVRVERGKRYQFAYRVPGGEWTDLGPTLERPDLPPWDLGVRLALTVDSTPAGATFNYFRVQAQNLDD